jgi:alkanesulfonate monooxygenase SsuD/methylene tetrahydromethanopterin reductase-like flavin-dependent oxidoreductase (luciferase family)
MIAANPALQGGVAMTVEFGLLLPTREAVMSGRPETAPLLTLAERAEAAGFDSVWIGDSITARPRHEPLTLLAAVAARTRRVRVGTAVLLPALRHPVVLAHVVGTLDRIAEGRVILGVGIAADTPAIRREFAAVGLPFERRVGRFLETLEICQALWRRGGVSFSGNHFTLRDVTVEPRPQHPGGPPIWIGGSGPTALREAARFDAWYPTGPTAEFFAEHFPRIRAAARAAGRPADAVAGAAYVTLALDPDRAAAERRLHDFLETYYAAPARALLARQACYAGPVEGAVEWLQRWIEAGARHLSLRFAGGDQLAQVGEAAAKLLPHLRRG